MATTSNQLKRLEDLSTRCWGVFREIVRLYIFDGCPVGSQAIAEIYHEGLSPASIRKVMGELEEAGLIFQPHVSAGRIPTDLGYRAYVDRFVGEGALDPVDRRAVTTGLAAEGEVQRLLDAASRLLSGLSHHVGVVVGPYLRRMTLSQIQFVRVGERRLLAVFIAESGIVVNRIVELSKVPTQEELDRFARMLLDEFGGRTLPEMRDAILARLRRERGAWGRLAREAMGLGLTALETPEEKESPDPTDVFVEGTSNLLHLADAADLKRLASLLDALHQKEKIIHLLDRCLEHHGVGALIGSESGDEDLTDLAVVAAAYHFRDRPIGTLGIIGPTRMEYHRNLALVNHIAATLSEILTEGSQ